jgi:hypothetical protein
MVSAVMYLWGEVVTGRRHRNVYDHMADKGITERTGCQEGFLGQSGTFYMREEAVSIAIASRQIPSDHAGEHLWPPTAREKSMWHRD